jgi:hypothetical protein
MFAWSYADMYGLDTDIVVHKVPLKEGSILVKQKLRRTWSTTQYKDQHTPSWMVSLGTTRSRWPNKIKRKQLSLHHEEPFGIK